MNLYNKPGMLIISYYLKLLTCKTKTKKNIISLLLDINGDVTYKYIREKTKSKELEFS